MGFENGCKMVLLISQNKYFEVREGRLYKEVHNKIFISGTFINKFLQICIDVFSLSLSFPFLLHPFSPLLPFLSSLLFHNAYGVKLITTESLKLLFLLRIDNIFKLK